MSKINEFKKELKFLLKKYNTTICFEASDCSDWVGMLDTRIAVYDNKTNLSTKLADGENLDWDDL